MPNLMQALGEDMLGEAEHKFQAVDAADVPALV
jgi:hypothetical protein